MSRLENIYVLLESYQENVWLDEQLRPTSDIRRKGKYYIICEIDKNTEQLQKRGDSCTLFFVCEDLNKEEMFFKITLTMLGHTEATVTRKVGELCCNKSPNLVEVIYTRSVEYLKHQLDFMMTKFEMKFDESMKVIYNSVRDDEELLEIFEVLIFQLAHGLCIMHQNYLQHRDVKKSILCIGESRHKRLQYVVDGVMFSVPAQFNGYSCVVKLTDFGLSHDGLNPFAEDEALNNTDHSLAPHFVFFNHKKDLKYYDSDEIFSTGMCILSAVTNFQMETLDRGIRREIIKFYYYQQEGGSPSVHLHLSLRNLAYVTYQAFRLILLLGYPTKQEMPEFYESLVGRAMLRVKPYLISLSNYDYLRKRMDSSQIHTKALQRMLRWNRSERIESLKHLLLSDLFQHYRTDSLDPEVPIYDNSKPI